MPIGPDLQRGASQEQPEPEVKLAQLRLQAAFNVLHPARHNKCRLDMQAVILRVSSNQLRAEGGSGEGAFPYPRVMEGLESSKKFSSG
jgi:hypothetical protein